MPSNLDFYWEEVVSANPFDVFYLITKVTSSFFIGYFLNGPCIFYMITNMFQNVL